MLRKRIALVAVVVVGALMAVAPAAFGAQSTNAACIGAGASALAPGQQEFFPPGTVAAVAHFLHEEARENEAPTGQIVKAFAQQKGSAEDCFPNGPPLP
jgi:hypothetical protein